MNLALLGLTLALSVEPQPAEAKPDVVGVVMEHITNSHSLEFQVPLVDKKIEIALPQWKIQLGSYVLDLSITKHVFWLWVISGLMAVVFVSAGRRKSKDEIPTGFAGVVEALVQFVRQTAVDCIGKHDADRYVPYLATVFCFVLVSGLVGMIPYTSTPTSNINVTAGLALCTFVLTQVAGMRAQGAVGYWTHLVPPGVPWVLYPIMFVVELLGIFTKPFALTVRLFANMNAGHIVILALLGLIFILGSPGVSVVSVPFAVAVNVLELLVVAIQAYIFMLLSATFIGLVMHGH
jgi:F-type H+-transporting ATPase subunit a